MFSCSLWMGVVGVVAGMAGLTHAALPLGSVFGDSGCPRVWVTPPGLSPLHLIV